MEATKVENAYIVEQCEFVENESWVAVKMNTEDYHEFRDLPNVLSYNGHKFVKMSWNSDKMRAYYVNRINTIALGVH